MSLVNEQLMLLMVWCLISWHTASPPEQCCTGSVTAELAVKST